MPAFSDPLVELLKRHASSWIRVEFRVAAQGLRNTLVLVVKNGWQGAEQMSGKNGAIGIREIECELFDFGDRGHIKTVARIDYGAKYIGVNGENSPTAAGQ
jgi:hypothetical protein